MKLKLALAILASLTLSSCYSFKSTLSSHVISTEKLKTPTKVGKACSDENNVSFPMSLFFIENELTVEKARSKAGITEIISVEQEISGNILSRKSCIVVKGN